MQAKSPPVRNTSVRTEPRYRPMQRRIGLKRYGSSRQSILGLRSVFSQHRMRGLKILTGVVKGLRDDFGMVVVFAAVVVAAIWAASPQFMYLLVGNEKEIVRIGVRCLYIVSPTFPFCVSLYLLTNFLRGAGEIAYPVFNIMLGLGFRTAFAFVSVRYIGGYGIMLCRPLGFLISTVSLSCRYFTKNWQGR